MKKLVIIVATILLSSCSSHERPNVSNCNDRVENLLPQYPAKALALGKEGVVRVGYTVGENGRARDVRIISATPPNLFERETLAAINRGCFASTTKEQVKVFTYSIGEAVRVEDDKSAGLHFNKELTAYATQFREAVQREVKQPENFAGKRCVLQINMQRNGQIDSVQAQGGDPKLCEAAINAVKTAKIPAAPNDEIYSKTKNARLDFAL
ncbi:cell envelope integrity protein TolA [Citrobacter freundii]|uniref:cell envelope integrity protein TolA n=1 Tax=Citrobacter freundii TaxID=546 RepID=UPI001BCBF783|nr:cell envelope integrity protein TolA [Citrobacter freundii]